MVCIGAKHILPLLVPQIVQLPDILVPGKLRNNLVNDGLYIRFQIAVHLLPGCAGQAVTELDQKLLYLRILIHSSVDLCHDLRDTFLLTLFFHRKSRSFLLLLMYFLHSIRQGSRRLCLLQPLLYLPLPLADRLGRILPCDITVQIFQQVLTGGFELIANQPQPQKPGAEGVLFVLRLGSGAHGPLLDQRLMGDCQTQLDVTLDFSRVEGRIEHGIIRSFKICSLSMG